MNTLLGKDDITAILLSWKRPETMQLLVDSLREYGIEHIWVWCQENVKPPKGASVVISSSENLGTWPRYAMAGLAQTSHIFFCDDDWCMLNTGLDALRMGASVFPNRILGLSGSLYRYPCINFRHRSYKRARHLRQPREVDLLHHTGVLGPRHIFQEMFGQADVWDCLRDSIGFTLGDDWAAMASLRIIGEEPPVIMPAIDRGCWKPADPAPRFAVSHRPNIRKNKQKAFLPLQRLGFKSIESDKRLDGQMGFAYRVHRVVEERTMCQKMKELERLSHDLH